MATVKHKKYFRKFDPTESIEMDRFVHTLNGQEDETIVRNSRDVSSTMKEENSMTVNRQDSFTMKL